MSARTGGRLALEISVSDEINFNRSDQAAETMRVRRDYEVKVYEQLYNLIDLNFSPC